MHRQVGGFRGALASGFPAQDPAGGSRVRVRVAGPALDLSPPLLPGVQPAAGRSLGLPGVRPAAGHGGGSPTLPGARMAHVT